MFGVEIVTSTLLVDTKRPFEDWSRVRSPARARRRRAKHRQNITISYPPSDDVLFVGGKVVCHPAMVAKIKAKLEAEQ